MTAATTVAAESPQQAFANAWTGQTVVVRHALYSLLYNERGRFNGTASGKRDGVLVATPSQGMYLQFDGRQGHDDVVEHDPQRLLAAVNTAYEEDTLDLRSYRKVEPLAVHLYQPGVELLVVAARVSRDLVVLDFAQPGGPDLGVVTSLRIKWPVPLSKSFSEREVVEGLIGQFVDPKRAR